MTTERVEVRLDPEDRRMLAELAERERSSMSDVVRKMIKKTYEDAMRERRMLAVERLAAMEFDEVPEPDELNRILDETHDVGDLY